MSNVIQLGEHLWTPPPAPTSMNDVLFSKDVKRNQYWRRLTDYPRYFHAWDCETKLFAEHTIYGDQGELVSLNRQESKRLLELRDQELKRRRDGVWFMNDGELTYMTGGYYFMLQWCTLQNYFNERTNSPYGEYREFQARLHYFLQMCKQDKDCLGAYILKPKKTGVTQLMACDFLDESTRMRGRWFGMMSKALVPDCRDNNFGMYKYAFENLPNIMKPSIANENLTMMFFGNPVNNKNNSRKNRAKTSGNLDWLNTRISALPTKDNAFDGGKPFRAWTDELPKYIDPYPDDVAKRTSPAVKMQEMITGKWWITSYTPEDDDKSKDQAEKLYYNSKLRTRDEATNRTKSELYTYFISVLDSAEGSFDLYGRADRRKNQIWVKREHEKRANDPTALQSFQRASPTTEEEAWRAGGGGGSTFDNIRLGNRKFIIEEDMRVGKYLFKEYNLEWVDGKYNKDRPLVVMKEVTEDDKLAGKSGLWRFYGMDYWRKESLNEFVTKGLKDRNGNWTTAQNVRFVGSMDPTNYSLGNLVLQGSKNSMWVFSLPDTEMNSAWKKCVSGRHVAEYLHRHNKPSETLEDLKKMICLFGCPVAIEGNMAWAITRLVEEGFQNFVLVRDKKTKAIVPYDPNAHQAMITTQKNTGSDAIDEYIRATSEYLAAPVIVDDLDNLDNVDSEVALDQLMRFDPEDTKQYDHAVGFMYAVQAMYNYVAYLTKRAGMKKWGDTETMQVVLNSLLD